MAHRSPLLCRALPKQTEMMWITCQMIAGNRSFCSAWGLQHNKWLMLSRGYFKNAIRCRKQTIYFLSALWPCCMFRTNTVIWLTSGLVGLILSVSFSSICWFQLLMHWSDTLDCCWHWYPPYEMGRIMAKCDQSTWNAPLNKFCTCLKWISLYECLQLQRRSDMSLKSDIGVYVEERSKLVLHQEACRSNALDKDSSAANIQSLAIRITVISADFTIHNLYRINHYFKLCKVKYWVSIFVTHLKSSRQMQSVRPQSCIVKFGIISWSYHYLFIQDEEELCCQTKTKFKSVLRKHCQKTVAC